MGFWGSELGSITGSEEDSNLPSFAVIPDNTMAIAVIKSCIVKETPATQYKGADRFIEVIYKITSNDYKNREVTQKIKVFNGEPRAIHRNLNMLARLMMICSTKRTHNDEPTNQDLMRLHGKFVGIKISEWSMPKKDGGIMEGNFVSAISSAEGFKCETGTKMEVVHTNPLLDSALSRNPRGVAADASDDLDDDVPF